MKKWRILGGVGIIIAVLGLFYVIFLKVNEGNSYIDVYGDSRLENFEQAGRDMTRKYLELRMMTESAIRGEMDFDEIDEIGIEWEEFSQATEVFSKILNEVEGSVDASMKIGPIGENGARKIVRDMQDGYGWKYPLVAEFEKINDMFRADAKTIGQQIKMAERNLGEFGENMKKIEEMVRVNIFVAGNGFAEEKGNLATEGITELQGVGMLFQVGKTNGNLVFGTDGDTVVFTTEDYRNMPSILEESSVVGIGGKDSERVVYLGNGLSGLVQVGRRIFGDVRLLDSVQIQFTSEKLIGVSTQQMREKNIEVVGEEMLRMKNYLDVRELGEENRVTWIFEKMEDYYARVAGS